MFPLISIIEGIIKCPYMWIYLEGWDVLGDCYKCTLLLLSVILYSLWLKLVRENTVVHFLRLPSPPSSCTECRFSQLHRPRLQPISYSNEYIYTYMRWHVLSWQRQFDVTGAICQAKILLKYHIPLYPITPVRPGNIFFNIPAKN